MSKIYNSGGAIVAIDLNNQMHILNPGHFDWHKRINNYFIRDGIENQSYDMGNLAQILDANDDVFSSASSLEGFLNNCINRTDVFIQDQITDVVNLYMNKDLSNFILSGVQTVGSHILNVVAGHTVVAGNYVCLQQVDTERNILRFFQASVVVAGATTLELSRPIDFAYNPTDVICSKATRVNMAGDSGTISSPTKYKIKPEYGKWDIYQIHIFIFTPSGTMDDGTFGPLTKLAHGITIRRVNGYVQNMYNFKTNGEILAFAEHSLGYTSKPPSGTGSGLSASISIISGNGVATRLDSSKGGFLEVWLPDSLASWPAGGELEIKVEGHVVQD